MTGREEKDKVAWIHQARSAAYKVFKTKWQQMEENSRFLRLQQYSESQLQKFEKDKRVPYVLDYINSAINTFQGIQRDRRTEIFYYAVENGDDVKVEVLNAVKDSVLQRNNFVYTESEVFKDGIVEKVGAVGYEWSKEKDKNGALKIFRYLPRSIMWDLNSRDYAKQDASWISPFRLLTKRDLSNRYPKDKKFIDSISLESMDWANNLGLDSTYVNEMMDKDLGAVALIEFFEKMWETRYFIRETTQDYIEPLYYDTQKAADAAVRQKLAEFEGIKSKLALTGQSVPPDPQLMVFADNFPVIEKSEVSNSHLFSTETLDEPFYPIDFYHSLEHDGDWYCPVDLLKDGQRFFNKMFSMADHWISSMSKGLLLADNKASKAEQKAVKDAFSTTGGAVSVEDVEAYKLFESKGPAPQLFTLLEVSRQNLEDNAGGRNFMGKKETASESGVAVRTRIDQGSLSGFVVYDNLRRWKMGVGEKVAWYLTHYMTVPQVVRIAGEELVQQTMQTLSQDEDAKSWFNMNRMRPGVGYLEVNTVPNNTIENLKVDCAVDEAKWSVSKNQSTLQEINLAMQSNPLLAQTFPPETLVKLMNLPFSEKEETLSRIKENTQRQIQVEQQKITKPPSLTAALGDIDKLPPEGAAQLAAQFNIKLDPNSIEDPAAREMALKAAEMMANHRLKTQEHELDMALTTKKANQDMLIQAETASMKNKLDHVKGLHKMHLDSQRQELMPEED